MQFATPRSHNFLNNIDSEDRHFHIHKSHSRPVIFNKTQPLMLTLARDLSPARQLLNS